VPANSKRRDGAHQLRNPRAGVSNRSSATFPSSTRRVPPPRVRWTGRQRYSVNGRAAPHGTATSRRRTGGRPRPEMAATATLPPGRCFRPSSAALGRWMSRQFLCWQCRPVHHFVCPRDVRVPRSLLKSGPRQEPPAAGGGRGRSSIGDLAAFSGWQRFAHDAALFLEGQPRAAVARCFAVNPINRPPLPRTTATAQNPSTAQPP
jgi:hypothetical protein